MGILSDFLIAESTPDCDAITHLPEHDRLMSKRITPLEAAGILSVLRSNNDRMSLLAEFPLLSPDEDEAEQWIYGVPGDMVESLSKLSSGDLQKTAVACALVTAQELNWSTDDFLELLSPLAELAQRAIDQGKSMFLWVSL